MSRQYAQEKNKREGQARRVDPWRSNDNEDSWASSLDEMQRGSTKFHSALENARSVTAKR